jgi:hypothetical protein|tara:strand:- start:1264 stop:1911 length:648 start_codon:yes stop_codon:yes gene_type:complete
MKKQLLNESEIRKMMKFANIGTLTDGFVDRLDEAAETTPLDEVDDLEEGKDPDEDDTEDVQRAAKELPGALQKVVDKSRKKKKKKKDGQNEGMYADRDEDAMEEGLLDEEEHEDDMSMEDDMDMDDDMDMEDDMGEPGGEMELSEEEAEVLISLGERLAAAQGGEEDLGDVEDDMGMDDMGVDDELPPEDDMPMEEDLVNEVTRRVSKRLLALRK